MYLLMQLQRPSYIRPSFGFLRLKALAPIDTQYAQYAQKLSICQKHIIRDADSAGSSEYSDCDGSNSLAPKRTSRPIVG